MAGYIGSQTPVVSNGSQRKYTFTATAAQTVFTGMDIPNPQQIQVFQNGVRLVITTDYTVSSGTTVTLVNAASAGDSLVVILFADYQLLDTDALTFTGGTTIEGDLTVDTNTLYVDSTNNRVGVGTASPSNPFQVGTSDLIVDSSGNVGIGTSTVNRKLEISGNNNGGAKANYIRITDTDTTATGGNQQGGIEFYTNDSGNENVTASIENLYAGSGAGSELTFNTAPNGSSGVSERLRIDDSGRVMIATSTPETRGITLYGNGVNGMYVKTTSTTNYWITRDGQGAGSGTIATIYSDTALVGSISVSATTTSYNTTSDHRLKENVTDVTDGITRVKQLEPKRFNFIADPDTTVDGFLAHQAQAVVPEAVTGTHNEVDDDGNAVMQGIDQSKLVPLLTAALKEAITKIETLETEMTSVKARLDALEGN